MENTTTAQGAQTMDEKVKALFTKVQEKKLSVAKAEKPNWSTGGIFGYSPNSAHDRTDIKITIDARKIVDMYAFLIDREDKTKKAAEVLEVSYDFTWLGYTVAEWKADFQTRINQLQLQAKKRELVDLENRLSAIISPELKAQMEFDAICALID